MKVALGMVVVVAAACGVPARQTDPVVTAGPDELTLRAIRRDAAGYLNCQVPAVFVEMGPWSGSQGNVIASGCGFMLHYYVVCQSRGHCGYTVAD